MNHEVFKEISKEIYDNYLDDIDWRTKENSNTIKSVGSLTKYVSGEVAKNYWLNHVYDVEDPRISEAYREGYVHIHDMSMTPTLYCCGYSLKEILMKGVRGVPNIPTSSPAKHFLSIINQVSNLITIFQNEICGAVAFSSIDTLLAPFIKVDNLTYEEVKQNLQNFLYSINSNSRAGAEPAFSNVTLDIECPKDLYDKPAIIGGEPQDFTYGDCQKEIDMFNRAFCELMIAGDTSGKPFAYPIPTYNIHEKFEWDNPKNNPIFEMSGKYGYPYFANFINSEMDIGDARSMCCVTGDTLVDVKFNKTGEARKERIENLVENYSKGDYKVLTPLGYKSVKETIRAVEEGEMYKIVISDTGDYSEKGDTVTLVTTANHPHIISNEHNKVECRADELEVGMTMYKRTPGYNPHIYTKEKILSIEKLPAKTTVVYDFELDSSLEDGHMFYINNILTHNCRLRLDLRELRRKNGGFFGSGDSTGSIGVVTINLPRIGFVSRKEAENSPYTKEEIFFTKLREYMDISAKSLYIKRRFLQENILDKGLIPAFMEYVGTMDNHFNTIGLVGMNEMCVNLLGKDIVSDEGKEFSLKVLDFMRDCLSDYQEESGQLFNLEATPAESTAYRLAIKDKAEFGDEIFTQCNEDPYYTNSCHMPVKEIKDLKQLFDHQDELQCKFTGGTVIHIYCGNSMTAEQAKSVVKSVLSNYNLPYISISPLITTCPEHGLLSKAFDHCPYCGVETDKTQRITGYLRRVSGFNKGKLAEFKDRNQLNI